MASWGRLSDAVLTGTGTINANTDIVTGANTAFTTEVEVRDLVDLGGDRFVVLSVNSDTELQVEPVAVNTRLAANVLLSEAPKYLTVTEATTEVTYVTVAEAQDANNRVIGVKTPGWTLYKEYGNGRRRVETLVAMKQTS